MPRLAPDDQNHSVLIQGTDTEFVYSAADINKLEEVGAPEYTLCTVAVDVSLSVQPFMADIEKALSATIESWRRHPRKDYLMVRVIQFGSNVNEVHGWKLLVDCQPGDYEGVLKTDGMTALYRAVCDGVCVMSDYAQKLVDRDFSCNAITVVLTDGADNRSGGVRASDVKTFIDAARTSEATESHLGILVGVNVQEPEVQRFLRAFEAEAGFDQYVELADAEPATLEKLGNFMTSSVAAQSQALGTGAASQPLAF